MIKNAANTNKKITHFRTKLPEGFEWATSLDRDGDEVTSLADNVWPEFLTMKPDLEIIVPHEPYQYDRYNQQRYFIWGIREIESNRLVACINSLSIDTHKEQEVFDQGGWQWALRASLEDEQVNTLCLTSVTVAREFRGLGFATLLVCSAKEQAKSLKFHNLLVPVRPTEKHRFPELSLEQYLTPFYQLNSQDNDFLDKEKFYDPWIKLHLKQGATLLNICEQSMVITASIRWWEERTNTSIAQLSEIHFPLGLVPLKIDQKNNMATYAEPNIWMKYSI